MTIKIGSNYFKSIKLIQMNKILINNIYNKIIISIINKQLIDNKRIAKIFF